MKTLKLRVLKKFEYNTKKGLWKRFKEVDKIILDDYSTIKTEADLCDYLFKKHGEGRYQILMWTRGQEGFICFWLGFLMPNGFIRDLNKNKELETLKNELKSAESYEEREEIEEEMQFEREISTASKGATRRGPAGFIRTFKPGQLHAYDEIPQERRIIQAVENNA